MDSIDRIYRAYSLVDITNTGVIRDLPGQELRRNQQRNWETVLQCIGLVAQPHILGEVDLLEHQELTSYEFGEFYTGQHRVWTFAFSVDREDVFLAGRNPVGQLEDNFAEVPVITYLTETARFMLPIFYTHGAIKNIYFKNGRSGLNIT